jgi:hypothetical protein
MRRRRIGVLASTMVLVIAFDLVALGLPFSSLAYNVIADQNPVEWGSAPLAHVFTVDPDLSSKLYVETSPGQFNTGQLADPITPVVSAANKWNTASRFVFSYSPAYTTTNQNISFVTAADLRFNWTNNCQNNNPDLYGVWCGKYDAAGLLTAGQIYFNNTIQHRPLTYNTNGIAYDTPNRRETDVHHLALHELGHILTLGDHPTGHPEAVMSWGNNGKTELRNDDKQGATIVHGPYTGFESHQAQGYASNDTPNRAAYQQTVSGYNGAPIPEMFPIQGDYLGVQPSHGSWHQHIAGRADSAYSYVYFDLFSYSDDSTRLPNGQPMPLANRRYAQIPANQPANRNQQTYLHWCQRNYQQATMSLDFELDNGQTLRDSGLLDDARVSVHPAQSGVYGTTYFCRDVNLARFAGRRIVRWFIAYDSGRDNFDIVGQQFRAYFDDVKFLPYGKEDNQALTIGGGSLGPGGPYGYNSLVSFNQYPASNWLFTGWSVDGVQAGWAGSLSATMTNRTVVAHFAPRPAYCDVPTSHPQYNAITQLGARGVIRGYTNGCFGPGDIVQRAQAAAFIARAMPSAIIPGQTWDWEDWGNPFSDRGGLDINLWRNVGTLHHYGVANGYDQNGCAARGVAYPCFGPTDQVLEVQVIAFISRAMVNNGRWAWQPSTCSHYAGVTAARQEICTYVAYAGGISFSQSDGYRPAARAWFAQQWWQALNSYWSVDRTP